MSHKPECADILQLLTKIHSENFFFESFLIHYLWVKLNPDHYGKKITSFFVYDSSLPGFIAKGREGKCTA